MKKSLAGMGRGVRRDGPVDNSLADGVTCISISKAPSSGGFGRGGGGDFGVNRDGFGDTPENIKTPDQGNEEESSGAPAVEHVTYVPEEVKVEGLWDQHICAGINFSRYGELSMELNAEGESPQHIIEDVKNISTFEELELDGQVLWNIKRMGYTVPTPIQKMSIHILRKCKRDIMACAQTGSGKTAAFLLPIIQHIVETKRDFEEGVVNAGKPYAIVIAPTRELAMQIYKEAVKFSNGTRVGCAEVYGGVAVRHQISNIRQGCDIIVGTIGRVKDFVGKKVFLLENIKFLVLDEADRMLDKGFGPDIESLFASEGMPAKENRNTLMFSATFPEEIQKLAKDHMNDHVLASIGQVGGANEDVIQEILECKRVDKKSTLLDLLRRDLEGAKDPQSEEWTKKTLVFVEGRKDVDFVGAIICQEDIPATTIHGDRTQEQREKAVAQFRSGHYPVMVCTNVAARGLDITGVDHVIQYDLPMEIEDYVHRIGRTGRVGNPGRSTAFYDTEKNCALAKRLIDIMRDAQQIVPEWFIKVAEEGGGGDFGGTGFGSGTQGFGAFPADDDWD